MSGAGGPHQLRKYKVVCLCAIARNELGVRPFSRFSRRGLPPRWLGSLLPILSSPLHGAAVTVSAGLRRYAGAMRRNLTRYYGAGDLHFITCSCYRRQPLLGSARRRDLFLTVLEQVRKRYELPGDVPAGSMANGVIQGNAATWRNASGTANRLLIATPFVPLIPAVAELGAAAGELTFNTSAWLYSSLEGLGLPLTKWLSSSAMGMGAPGLLTVGARFGVYLYDQCKQVSWTPC